MPQAKKRYVWEADVSLELRNLALAIRSKKGKKGSREVYFLSPQDWYDGDGSIIFDVGKRLRGWFVQQGTTAKKSLGEALRYGLKCDSVPTPGFVPVAKLSDITASSHNEIDQDKYYFDETIKKLGPPFVEAFTVKEGTKLRPVFSFHYTIDKPIKVDAKIYSFASNFMPEGAEEMLSKLGHILGLGDRHAQGFGCFKLLKFKSEITELNI